MLLPKALKSGDTVGIVVPSGLYRPENSYAFLPIGAKVSLNVINKKINFLVNFLE